MWEQSAVKVKNNKISESGTPKVPKVSKKEVEKYIVKNLYSRKWHNRKVSTKDTGRVYSLR